MAVLGSQGSASLYPEMMLRASAMDRKSLGLRTLQWFFRGMQCACATIILAIYSYILVTLHNHKLSIKNPARAVEGIAGFAVLYAIAAIILLCCIAGRTLAAFAAMVFDFAFVVAFIYVAAANKAGASSCSGEVNTMFGTGNSTERVDNEGHGGFTKLPTYKQACKLESAVLGLAIIAIFFFVFSLLTEVALGRSHWRQKRQANDPDHLPTAPAGPVIPPAPGTLPSTAPKPSFWSRLLGRKNQSGNIIETENMLPRHPTPSEMQQRPEPPTHGTVTDLGEPPNQGKSYEPVIPGEGEGYQSPTHVVPQQVSEYSPQEINNPYDVHQGYDAPSHTAGITGYDNNYNSHSHNHSHSNSYPNVGYGSISPETSYHTPDYDITPGYGNTAYANPTHNASPVSYVVTMPVPTIPYFHPATTSSQNTSRPLPYPQTPPPQAHAPPQPHHQPYNGQYSSGVSPGYPTQMTAPRPPAHSVQPYSSSAAAGMEVYGERPGSTGGRLPEDYRYDDGLYDR